MIESGRSRRNPGFQQLATFGMWPSWSKSTGWWIDCVKDPFLSPPLSSTLGKFALSTHSNSGLGQVTVLDWWEASRNLNITCTFLFSLLLSAIAVGKTHLGWPAEEWNVWIPCQSLQVYLRLSCNSCQLAHYQTRVTSLPAFGRIHLSRCSRGVRGPRPDRHRNEYSWAHNYRSMPLRFRGCL